MIIRSCEPPIEPKEDVVVAVCKSCKNEIYLYEEYGEDDLGEVICKHCIENKWNGLMLSEKLEVFGYHPVAQTLTVNKVSTIRRPPLV